MEVVNFEKIVADLEQKELNYITKLIFSLGLPFLGYFIVKDLLSGNYMSAGVTIPIAILIAILLPTVRKITITKDAKNLYFKVFSYIFLISIGIAVTYYIGNEGYSRVPWFYFIPLLAFLMLGHQTGLILTAVFLSLHIISNSFFPNAKPVLIEDLRMRFFISIILITVISYFLERWRHDYKSALVNAINKQRQAEEDLKIAAQTYKRIFENIPVSVMVVDKSGIVQDINPYHLKHIGKGLTKKQDHIGQILMERMSVQKAGLSESVQGVLEGKSLDKKSVYFPTTTGGDDRFFNVKGEPLIGSNQEVIGAVFIHEDVTERKQAEKIESQLKHAQKMEAVGTLAGGIAHEFNNMLGVILGNAELAIDDIPKGNPAVNYLKDIQAASLRSKEVVRKLMSIARKSPSNKKPVQISRIVRESVMLLSRTIPSTINIQQEIVCEQETILADPTEIHQVLINLCTNSQHAIQAETGNIHVKLDTVALDRLSANRFKDLKPGYYVKLTVTDTGEGIDPDIKDRIFDPYFTTKDVDEGLGMGMAIVHSIIKKHDGAIHIDSEIGSGTTVDVFFPLIDADVAVEIKKPDSLPTGTEGILVIDDEPSLLKTVTQIIERYGYKVVGQTSSREALNMFQSQPNRFDLVITDMAMPKIPGDRVAQEMFRLRPGMPIILCTGHSDRIDENKAKALGIKAFIMKPFSKNDMMKTIRKVLDEAKG